MKKILTVLGCIATMSLVFVVYGQTATQSGPAAAPSADAVAAQKAILTQYCATCHSDKAKSAGMDSARKIDFDALDIAHVGKDAETWERIVRKLRAGMMPPKNKARPTAEQLGQLETWVKGSVFKIDPKNPDPGRVTVRRLNRVEYRNTVRDLMGVGRKAAQLYLERFDSDGLTRRVGDVRVLRRKR